MVQSEQKVKKGNPLLKALGISAVIIVLCGLVYPLLMTGIGQLVFPWQANGSMVMVDGKVVGSELIGQDFTDPRFFQGRVSAVGYNTYPDTQTAEEKGVSSGSANYAPSNPALLDRVKKDLDMFLAAHPGTKMEDIPTDLLTSSGSGLDPDISVQAAQIQIPAISKASGIPESELQSIVEKCTIKRTLGFLGNERVNVFKANIMILQRLG